MHKNTQIVVIGIAVVLVIGGTVIGVMRWREQRRIEQFLRGAYPGDSALLEKLTGDRGLAQSLMQELAKQAAQEEAQQIAEQVTQEGRTPEEIFRLTEEMSAYDTNSTMITQQVKALLQSVFGQAKVVSLSTGLFGLAGAGSGIVECVVPRAITAEDVGRLTKWFTDQGLPVLQSGVQDGQGSVMAGTNASGVYTMGFAIGDQKITVTVVRAQ